MIKAEIKNTIKFPKDFLKLDDLTYVADKIFITQMVDGIHRREAINGGSLPKLEPVTIRMKKGNDRPLIDTGTLVGSFYSTKRGTSSVVVSILGRRIDEARRLQVEGVESKRGRKFFRFFGISDGMASSAYAHLQDKVNAIIKAFNGK